MELIHMARLIWSQFSFQNHYCTEMRAESSVLNTILDRDKTDSVGWSMNSAACWRIEKANTGDIYASERQTELGRDEKLFDC